MTQIERVKHFQELLNEIEEENHMLLKFAERLELIQKHNDEMGEYYQNDWMDDYTNFKDDENTYPLLNQDSIYNALYDQNNLLLKLNKIIANQLYRGEDQ